MQLLRGYSTVSSPFPNAVVSIGNFDGVHMGHREILRRAKEKAQALGGPLIVYTFRPHPKIALYPEQAPALLLTYDEKLKKFEELGVDIVIEEPFSREFSIMAARSFFNEVLLRALGACAIVVGYDFGFGKSREGNLDVLKKCVQSENVTLDVVEPFQCEGRVVSSSTIRKVLGDSQVEIAEKFLGASFFYRGVVLKGDHRGRKLGFNTANTRVENKLLLPYGVYGTTTSVLDDQGRVEKYLGVSISNFGIRPTFVAESGSQTPVPLLETHIFNFDGDIYGRQLEVSFKSFVRTERKFSNVEELKSQIHDDIKKVRASA